MYNYIPMSNNEIINLVRCNNNCILAMTKNNFPYAVPMYYEAYFDSNRLYLIMKSNSYGKKMNYMDNNERVCIVIEDRSNCKSVIIYGIACILNTNDCDNGVIVKVIVEEITGRNFCCN